MGTLTGQTKEQHTMRKIESEMLKAIFSGNRFAKNNTRVDTTDTCAEVYLFGNHIATVSRHGTVEVNTNTLLDYPTRTTLSRLRALGVKVRIHKGVVYLNDEPLSFQNRR